LALAGVLAVGCGLSFGATTAKAQAFGFSYASPGFSLGVGTGAYPYGVGAYPVVPAPVVPVAPVIAPPVVVRPVYPYYRPVPYYGYRHYGYGPRRYYR
jgi:hypothetical protein